jgi:hypothetical protein
MKSSIAAIAASCSAERPVSAIVDTSSIGRSLSNVRLGGAAERA